MAQMQPFAWMFVIFNSAIVLTAVMLLFFVLRQGRRINRLAEHTKQMVEHASEHMPPTKQHT